MAQKQSKVEKLLKFLVNNENEKFTKTGIKLDAETATAFEAGSQTNRFMRQIWNQQEVTVAKDFFQAYVDATKANFISICQEAGADPAATVNVWKITSVPY